MTSIARFLLLASIELKVRSGVSIDLMFIQDNR